MVAHYFLIAILISVVMFNLQCLNLMPSNKICNGGLKFLTIAATYVCSCANYNVCSSEGNLDNHCLMCETPPSALLALIKLPLIILKKLLILRQILDRGISLCQM